MGKLTAQVAGIRIAPATIVNNEYKDYKQLPPALLAQQCPIGPVHPRHS